MTEIKLGKIPDRTPVKLTIVVPPDLHGWLQDYAVAYAEAYGQQAAVTELIPAMLSAYLESDRNFKRSRPKS